MDRGDYYKVLLVGASGDGKTYSARNMNRDTTAYINAEDKPLPFKGNFKYSYRPKNLSEVRSALIEAGKNKEVTSIFLDSVSAVFEMVLLDARARFKNFDTWNHYNTEIQNLISLIKKIPKEIFITAHYEILNIEGSPEKRVKVKGKELEGVIEREFTMVLYSSKKFDEKGKPSYFYNAVQEGSSAKCPPDMFGEDVMQIPNDTNIVLNKILEFVGYKTVNSEIVS